MKKLFLLALLLLPNVCFAQSYEPGEIVYHGSPNPTQLTISNYDHAPWNGMITNFTTPLLGWVHQRLFDPSYTFTDAELSALLTTWRAINLTHLKKNYSRIDCGRIPVDWFDDWTVPLANLEKWAKFSRDAGMRGIFLDCESYDATKPFQYSTMDYKATKTRAQYETQVKARAKEVMQAINRGWPGARIVLATDYNFVINWDDEYWEYVPMLETSYYAMTVHFLTGLYVAADDKTILAAGSQTSYSYTTNNQFRDERSRSFNDYPKYGIQNTTERAVYLNKIESGHGIRVDNGSGGLESTVADSVKFALTHTGGIVWIYDESTYGTTGAALRAAIVSGRDAAKRFHDVCAGDEKHRIEALYPQNISSDFVVAKKINNSTNCQRN